MRTCTRVARRRRWTGWTLVGILCAGLSSSAAAAATAPDTSSTTRDGGEVALDADWVWPVQPFRLERAFVAPPHAYGPGHRGIDLVPLRDGAVRAPASGLIAFSGQVAGRLVLTIDHGDGLVSTLEPVESPLGPGTTVTAGATVGHLSTGGHAEPGSLHFGVRLDGEYINPLVLLGGVPRAVLLPCC